MQQGRLSGELVDLKATLAAYDDPPQSSVASHTSPRQLTAVSGKAHPMESRETVATNVPSGRSATTTIAATAPLGTTPPSVATGIAHVGTTTMCETTLSPAATEVTQATAPTVASAASHATTSPADNSNRHHSAVSGHTGSKAATDGSSNSQSTRVRPGAAVDSSMSGRGGLLGAILSAGAALFDDPWAAATSPRRNGNHEGNGKGSEPSGPGSLAKVSQSGDSQDDAYGSSDEEHELQKIMDLPELSWARVRLLEDPEAVVVVRWARDTLGPVSVRQEAAMVAAIANGDPVIGKLFGWFGQKDVFRFVGYVRAHVGM
jgi:hypothetical protein